MLLGEPGIFTLSHHHVRFGGSRSYSSGDVIFPILIPIPMPSSNAEVYKWPNRSSYKFLQYIVRIVHQYVIIYYTRTDNQL